MRPSKRGWGTVEFIACREEVAQLLLAGHTLTAIHQVLKETGKISMGYSRFYALVGRYKLLKPVLPRFSDEITHSSKEPAIAPVSAVSAVVMEERKRPLGTGNNDATIKIENDPEEQRKKFL